MLKYEALEYNDSFTMIIGNRLQSLLIINYYYNLCFCFKKNIVNNNSILYLFNSARLSYRQNYIAYILHERKTILFVKVKKNQYFVDNTVV